MATITDIFETLEYGPAPEAPNPALKWIEEHQPFGLFIGGEWRKPSGGKYFDSQNPSTDKPLAKVALGTAKDATDAIEAARSAFKGWSKLSGHARARYLYAIARQVQKHSRLLAGLESMDNGKSDTRDPRYRRPTRRATLLLSRGLGATDGRANCPAMEPLGVVGQIIPWNFPYAYAGMEDSARDSRWATPSS